MIERHVVMVFVPMGVNMASHLLCFCRALASGDAFMPLKNSGAVRFHSPRIT